MKRAISACDYLTGSQTTLKVFIISLLTSASAMLGRYLEQHLQKTTVKWVK